MKASTIIRRLDMFGVPITFVGLNRLKYQTKMGGIVSVIIVSWLMYNVILQFISLIGRSTLIVSTNTNFNDNPKLIQINYLNYMFALQVRGQILKHYFVFKLQAYTVTDGIQQQITDIPFAPCELRDFEQLYFYNDAMRDSLLLNGITEWMCPQLDRTYNLQGKYGSKQFQYFKVYIILQQIVVNKCAPGVYPFEYTCPSWDETVKFIEDQNYEVNINFLQSNVNVNTAQAHSYTGFIDRDYFMMLNPLKQFGQVDIFLREWDVYTNPSIIDDKQQDHQNYLVSDKQDTIGRSTVREYNDQAVAKMYIRNSQYQISSKRHYVSMGDFLAYVGGLFGSLFVMANAVMSLYAQEQLWLKLFKVYYNIIAEDPPCKSLNDIVDLKFSSTNIIIPKLKSFLFVCWKAARQNVYTYFEAQAIIFEDLSIVSYIRMQKDVQKMKQILLTTKQQQVLDLYNKETIVMNQYQQQHSHKLEEGKKYLYGHQFQERTLQQYQRIIDMYDDLLKSKDKLQLQITKRMINVFDRDLQFIITNGDTTYARLKTKIFNTEMSDMSSVRSQYSVSRDITRLTRHTPDLQLNPSEVESLLKSLFFRKQSIQISADLHLLYECEIARDSIQYLITINNNFQQYHMVVGSEEFITEQSYVTRKHRIICQVQDATAISIEQLIKDSIKITLNDHKVYLNCSLSASIEQGERVNVVPYDFRTQLYLPLDQFEFTKYQQLTHLFHNLRFKIDVQQMTDIIVQCEEVPHQQRILLLLNWPNSELILNEQIIQQTQIITLLQCMHDLFIMYLLNH